MEEDTMLKLKEVSFIVVMRSLCFMLQLVWRVDDEEDIRDPYNLEVSVNLIYKYLMLYLV